jgi:hypothetical protein
VSNKSSLEVTESLLIAIDIQPSFMDKELLMIAKLSTANGLIPG